MREARHELRHRLPLGFSMFDIYKWSLPVARLFGVDVRVHLAYPVVIVPMVLRVSLQDNVAWNESIAVAAIMTLSILAHEFGHVFAARYVGGESDEIMLWPLGGLARANFLPNTPRANFIFALGGPLVNLAILAVTTVLLAVCFDHPYAPPLNPIWKGWASQGGAFVLPTWEGYGQPTTSYWLAFLVWVAWIQWFLSAFNLLLIGWPWDSGAMLRAGLWPRIGYEQATQVAVTLGIFVAAILFMASLFTSEPLLIGLALYGGACCWMEWLRLFRGGEDSLFGYDFSQGYTSLEREEPKPSVARRKGNFLSRWLERRKARQIQKEHEQQEADERRMDELLDKIQRSGKKSLTDEENRFMERVSRKFRNRN
jgi:Zn-dependent protease